MCVNRLVKLAPVEAYRKSPEIVHETFPAINAALSPLDCEVVSNASAEKSMLTDVLSAIMDSTEVCRTLSI